MKCIFFILTFVTTQLSFAQNCDHLKTILPESTKNYLVVYKAIKKQMLHDPKLENAIEHGFYDEPEVNSFPLYIADVNNDGKKEYIFTRSDGTGSYVSLFIFSKQGNKFHYIGEPPKPAIYKYKDGGWFSSEYYNKKAGQIQFLVRGCSKVYMQFQSVFENYRFDPNTKITMERYLWKNGATTKVWSN